MKKSIIACPWYDIPVILLSLVLAVCAEGGEQATPATTPSEGHHPVSENDEESVRTAAAGFYTALNIMFTGDLEPMKDVWSHAADVTYMGPGGGMQVGWTEVLKEWEKQAAAKLGGTVEVLDMRIILSQDTAITQNYEKGENKGEDGKGLPVLIRATNIFRMEGGAWKMISHHTDILPHLER